MCTDRPQLLRLRLSLPHRYRDALEPTSPCSSQHSDTFGAYCDNRQGKGADEALVNDMDMMRDFMAFVVTRLQVHVLLVPDEPPYSEAFELEL